MKGREESGKTLRVDRRAKKEEFAGVMFAWCLGTPFPRSALFLKTLLVIPKKVTRVLRF
jgi:hypothetical protein